MSGSILDAIAHPAQVDVAGAYGKANQLAHGIWENRSWQARQAAGQAFQNSLNPDGTPNQLRLNQNLVAAGPQAALAAQDSSQAGQTLDNATFDTHMKRLTGVNAAAMALTAQYPGGVPQEAVNAELDRVGPTMGLSPQQIAQAKQSFGPDPRANSLTIIRNGMQNLQAQAALHEAMPGTGVADTGPTLQGYQVAPPASGQPGQVTPVGGAIPKATGPETNAALVETYVPDPQRPGSYLKVQVPRSSLPGASGAAAVPSAIPGNGSYPTARPAQAAPPGTALAAPPQGVTEGNAADIPLYKQAQAQVPAANNAVQNLTHAYDALKLTNSGKSTETTHAMYSLLSAQGLLPQGLTDDVKNYDLFRKYTEKYALDQGASSGTDAGRAMSAASNAGTSISTPANFDVLRNEIGRQRQAIAQVAEHQDPTGVGYGAHVQKFSSSTDPRGFSISMYSPDEVKKIVSGMKDNAEREKFWRSVGIAKRLGLIDTPSGSAP